MVWLKWVVIALVALVVLVGLFAFQRFGTSKVGKTFGPVMLLWFAALTALGIPQIIANPSVLEALNPWHALSFAWSNKMLTFLALGAIVLVVTGGEALYADLGHFGKKPIRVAWYLIVMPALVVNYFGQGAMLLARPETIKNPFYLLAPAWAEIPLFVLATAAAIVASQALITAAFSVTKQAIQLGILPRMAILHTSVRDTGQIYVPFVNWGLFVFIVLAVALFRNSSSLASAYGIAVTLDMTITTVMTFFVIRFGWKYPLIGSVAATVFFFVIVTQGPIGEALAWRHLFWSLSDAMCGMPEAGPNGAVQPNVQGALAYRVIATMAYPRLKELVENAVASGLIYLNSHAIDFKVPELRGYIDKYIRGSYGHDAEDRVKTMRLLWDAIGTEFGSRHELYERNYAGNHENIRLENLWIGQARGLDKELMAFAERCMGEYDLDGWTVGDLVNPTDVNRFMGKR